MEQRLFRSRHLIPMFIRTPYTLWFRTTSVTKSGGGPEFPAISPDAPLRPFKKEKAGEFPRVC